MVVKARSVCALPEGWKKKNPSGNLWQGEPDVQKCYLVDPVILSENCPVRKVHAVHGVENADELKNNNAFRIFPGVARKSKYVTRRT